MGMKDELKQIQETRVAGKEASDKLVDPGPFDTPLKTPDKKAADEEPDEDEHEDKKVEVDEDDEDDEGAKEPEGDEDDVPADKLESTLKKYKTPEAAAKATYNAQKRMNKATTETAELRRENEELKRARYNQPPVPPAITQKPEIPIEDVLADKFYAEIERLPDTEPDRDKKVVKLMAKMNAEISEAKRIESEKKSDDIDRQIKRAEGKAIEFGLDKEMLPDFWAYSSVVPKHLPEDEAVQWIVERINRLRGNEETIKEKTLEHVRKDEKEKKRMASLGKGSIKPAARKPDEDEGPSTLSDALRNVARQRVLK